MLRNKRFYLSYAILCCMLIMGVTPIAAKGRAVMIETIADGDSIAPFKKIPYYSFINKNENNLIFPGGFNPIDRFEAKLEQLLRTSKGSINIWHVGGSHVQADMFSHRMRCNFESLTDIPATREAAKNRAKRSANLPQTGTRGMLFPFSMAKTNYGFDHRFSYTGQWNASRIIASNPSLPIGMTGIAASTTSTKASITMRLDNGTGRHWQFDALRVIAEAEGDSVTVSVSASGMAPREMTITGDGVFEIDKLGVRSACTIHIDNPQGKRFILHGIEPISTTPGKINYYSSGINGASTTSWLRAEQLEEDLQLIKPDMVVFGIGINDAAGPHFDSAAFEDNYRKIIKKVLDVNPDCLLLFVTNNDSYYRGSPNRNAITVRNSFMKLAKHYNGCVWDCFSVMGGLGSSTSWRRVGLMANDRIHFSRKGYELIADMIFNALLTDFLENDSED